MARYEDYLDPTTEGDAVVTDELEQEIGEASDNSQDRQEEAGNREDIPERFKGKSPEEIAMSYAELEKAYSRQGNDLGELRKTVDDLIRLQSEGGNEGGSYNDTSSYRNTNQPTNNKEADQRVSVDDLYEDTEGAISRVVDKSAGSRIEQLEQQIAQSRIERELEQFEQEFPGWQQEAATPEFANWVAESPFRQRLAQAANGYDMSAAKDLFSLFKEQKSVLDSANKAKRNRDLEHASLESGGAEAAERPQKFSRRALMEKRIASKRGDYEAEQWLADNAESIAIAYEEGRITD